MPSLTSPASPLFACPGFRILEAQINRQRVQIKLPKLIPELIPPGRLPAVQFELSSPEKKERCQRTHINPDTVLAGTVQVRTALAGTAEIGASMREHL
jgi:hypothetical protein